LGTIKEELSVIRYPFPELWCKDIWPHFNCKALRKNFLKMIEKLLNLNG